ncbi:MAG: T9SS type A sorting domain-containing protein [Ignavibacteria bacterium]|nr:T9SS type A sorting domain-containing protein [Ignavibacteria bacterium]
MIHNYWFEWDSTYWLKDNLYSHTYDANNYLIQTIGQNWVGLYWEKDHRITITYNGNYNNTEKLYERWDGSDWYFYDKGTYSYIVSGVEQFNNVISSYSLSSNYPNPFNPTTTINYEIPQRSFITLKIYDVLGNEVATLVDEEKQTGSYNVELNATGLPSGIYIYKFQAGNFVETKKMVLIK